MKAVAAALETHRAFNAFYHLTESQLYISSICILAWRLIRRRA